MIEPSEEAAAVIALELQPVEPSVLILLFFFIIIIFLFFVFFYSSSFSFLTVDKRRSKPLRHTQDPRLGVTARTMMNPLLPLLLFKALSLEVYTLFLFLSCLSCFLFYFFFLCCFFSLILLIIVPPPPPPMGLKMVSKKKPKKNRAERMAEKSSVSFLFLPFFSSFLHFVFFYYFYSLYFTFFSSSHFLLYS